MAGEPILIVDDNATNLKLTKVLVVKEGYAVHTASDAEEALKQAQALLDAATKDEAPLDAELKDKIDKAMARARQPAATPPAKPNG